MISASIYRLEHAKLMTEYETRVRKWLKDSGEHSLADKIPFFKDGVTCPEKWFAPENDFRPLFILKEVSLGIDTISSVDEFLTTWKNQTSFDFAENPFDDIKIGRFPTWRRIAALAKGLESLHSDGNIREYDITEFAFKEGGEKYIGDIPGYREHPFRTANKVYNDIIEKIAVLEVKKIGGGTYVTSKLSQATKYYSDHISPFQDLICQEIELINPSVIICCSRDFFTYNLLSSVREQTSNRLWIYGYHPTRTSTKNFYDDVLLTYKELLNP